MNATAAPTSRTSVTFPFVLGFYLPSQAFGPFSCPSPTPVTFFLLLLVLLLLLSRSLEVALHQHAGSSPSLRVSRKGRSRIPRRLLFKEWCGIAEQQHLARLFDQY